MKEPGTRPGFLSGVANELLLLLVRLLLAGLCGSLILLLVARGIRRFLIVIGTGVRSIGHSISL